MSRLEMSEIFLNPSTRLYGVGRDFVFSRYQENIKLISVNIGEVVICMNSYNVAEEQKTNLMSLAILFYFLCTQHFSNINISIIRSLRLFCWITTLVVLFLVRCVLVIWCGWAWVVSVLQAEAWFSLQHGYHSNPAAPNLQHTANQEQNDQCGNSTAQSQAPDDGYISVRNMLST